MVYSGDGGIGVRGIGESGWMGNVGKVGGLWVFTQ